jgi:serine/threonine protein kinase
MERRPRDRMKKAIFYEKKSDSSELYHYMHSEGSHGKGETADVFDVHGRWKGEELKADEYVVKLVCLSHKNVDRNKANLKAYEFETEVLRQAHNRNQKRIPKLLVFGIVSTKDSAFIVMEKLNSQLDVFLEKCEQPLISIKAFFHGALKCIQELHSLGFMHRDLKPSNFMLRSKITTGGGVLDAEEVCLIDFGCAVHQESSHERKHSKAGTTRWRSVRSHEGKDPTFFCDYQSLGFVVAGLLGYATWSKLRPGNGNAGSYGKAELSTFVRDLKKIFLHDAATGKLRCMPTVFTAWYAELQKNSNKESSEHRSREWSFKFGEQSSQKLLLPTSTRSSIETTYQNCDRGLEGEKDDHVKAESVEIPISMSGERERQKLALEKHHLIEELQIKLLSSQKRERELLLVLEEKDNSIQELERKVSKLEDEMNSQNDQILKAYHFNLSRICGSDHDQE